MKYNIYISSHFESKPPYDIVEHRDYLYKRAFMWKSDETVWHYIGSADSLDDIRYAVEHNKQSYKNIELNCEPSDEWFCDFVKIEGENNFIEYYDRLDSTENKIYNRRKINDIQIFM